jgi:guanylate kinase
VCQWLCFNALCVFFLFLDSFSYSKRALMDCASKGKVCLLDLDIQGVQQFKKRRELTFVRYVFVKPPSLDVLERRLRGRGTESENGIRKRLARAVPEISYGTNSRTNSFVVFISTFLVSDCCCKFSNLPSSHVREHTLENKVTNFFLLKMMRR